MSDLQREKAPGDQARPGLLDQAADEIEAVGAAQQRSSGLVEPHVRREVLPLAFRDVRRVGEDGVEEDPLQGFEQVAPDQLDSAGKAEASQILRRELQ